MRILATQRKTWRLPDLALLSAVFVMCLGRLDACGSYGEVSPGASYGISSPANYGAYEHCVWWMVADPGYQLKITLNFTGQAAEGRCGDYIVIKDGSATASDLLAETCATLTNQVVTASARWLWIQFKSDGVNSTSGFQGTLTSTYIGDAIGNYTDPVVDCRSFEWSCENKMCLTLSYRCDGYNDCGCDDCDEGGCQGLPLDRLALIMIGMSVGFAIFLAFFFFAFAYETHLKKRAAMADPEAQAELQKQKAGKKRKKEKKKAMREKKASGWA